MTPRSRWKVLAHGPIARLADNLWRVSGTLSAMSLRRTMTLARLDDGRLVIHNAIALEEAAMRDVESFGVPSFLLVPNGFHRLDAPRYKARYPAPTVLAPAGSRRQVERRLAVDGTFADFPTSPAVELDTLTGTGAREGVMRVRSSDGITLVLCDIVFNINRKLDPLLRLFTMLCQSAPGPRVSRLTKMILVKDRVTLRAELERLAATPNLVRLIVAHEDLASGPDAAAALRAAAASL